MSSSNASVLALLGPMCRSWVAVAGVGLQALHASKRNGTHARSLTILEGIALASDPDYKVLGAAYPWVARRLLTDPSPELRTTLRRLLYTPQGVFRFERLEALLEQAVRSPPAPKRGATPGAHLTISSRARKPGAWQQRLLGATWSRKGWTGRQLSEL